MKRVAVKSITLYNKMISLFNHFNLFTQGYLDITDTQKNSSKQKGGREWETNLSII